MTSYVYDAAGQLISRTNDADDRPGLLVRARNPAGELVFTRDALGDVVTETFNGHTLRKLRPGGPACPADDPVRRHRRFRLRRRGSAHRPASGWWLPDADLAALGTWGLPTIAPSRFTPDLQTGGEPRILDEGRSLYHLVTMPQEDLAAVEDTGTVLGIPELEGLGTGYVDASVALFVDTAWRWYTVNTALRALPLDDVTYDRLEQLWDRIRKADPTIEQDPPVSLWRGLIEGW